MLAKEGVFPEPVKYVGAISKEEIERIERESSERSGDDE
ncbi:MAG: hypothetical protein JWM74_2660 [Myxococcaceae bacterium]|nr:hypothetical protein [Myxococcaceae bacterium]